MNDRKRNILHCKKKAIFNVYNGLGPGLLESVYHKILIYELEDLELNVKSEVSMPIIYNRIIFNCEFFG